MASDYIVRPFADRAGERPFTIRLATFRDIPALHTLIDESVRQLSVGYLSQAQIESELRFVIAPDTQLIADGTYYVAEAPDGALAGAGGWSRRQALYGGDQHRTAALRDPHAVDPDALLDPSRDPARIRAMFTSPRWARRGVARAIFERSRAAAVNAGFSSLILTATMPGVPLYQALGFRVARRYMDHVPAGIDVPVCDMTRAI